MNNPTVDLNRPSGVRPPRTGGFRSALRYEWTNLSTLRTTWVLSGLVVLLQVVYTLFDNREDTPGTTQFSSGLTLLTMITAVLVSAIGVNAFGAEFRYRTIVTTVLTVRSRVRVVLAKAVVVAGFGAVTSLVAVLVAYLGVLTIGATTAAPASVAVAGLGAVLYVTLSGLVGLALAGLTRHAVAALGVMILWPAVLETTLVGAFDVNPTSLPFISARMLAGNASDPQWYLPLPLTGVAVVLLIGAVTALSRRDA